MGYEVDLTFIGDILSSRVIRNKIMVMELFLRMIKNPLNYSFYNMIIN